MLSPFLDPPWIFIDLAETPLHCPPCPSLLHGFLLPLMMFWYKWKNEGGRVERKKKSLGEGRRA
jgi:hypothetical protein